MGLDNTAHSICSLVNQAAAKLPIKPFLIAAETGETVTFQQLQEQCAGLTNLFAERGLEWQDKIAFVMDNGLATAQLFLAAMYGGFVAVPLNVRAGPLQLSYMLEHCDAKLLFVDEQYRSLVEEAMQDVRRSIQVIDSKAGCVIEALAASSGSSLLGNRSRMMSPF